MPKRKKLTKRQLKKLHSEFVKKRQEEERELLAAIFGRESCAPEDDIKHILKNGSIKGRSI